MCTKLNEAEEQETLLHLAFNFFKRNSTNKWTDKKNYLDIK